MRKEKIKLLSLALSLLVLSFLASACTITTTSSTGKKTINSSNDGGFWLSLDAAENWQQRVIAPNVSGKALSLANYDIRAIRQDPQDSNALYLATLNKGLFYTYGLSDGWSMAKELGNSTIIDLQIDPKDKCSIYVAIDNKLYKSNDCMRSWSVLYTDNNPGVYIASIAIDHYNNSNVYIGTSRGDIIKSIDFGRSWRTIERLKSGLAKILISPQDSRLVYVASIRAELYSFNSPSEPQANQEDSFLLENWTNLGEIFKSFKIGSVYRGFVIAPVDGSLLFASSQALLRSTDQGKTWENIKLIPPEKDSNISSIAINPQDSTEIYYASNNVFFSSSDAGLTWTTKKVLSSREINSILVDQNNPKIIYLGFRKIKK